MNFFSSISSTINSSFCDSLDDFSTTVDFAGIHGSVKLYSTPIVHTSDVTYATHYNYHKATVKFIAQVEVDYRAKKNDIIMSYELLDQEGKVAAFTMGVKMLSGELTVFYPKLWWPVGMSDRPGYLYTLKVIFLILHVHNFSRLTVAQNKSLTLIRRPTRKAESESSFCDCFVSTLGLYCAKMLNALSHVTTSFNEK